VRSRHGAFRATLALLLLGAAPAGAAESPARPADPDPVRLEVLQDDAGAYAFREATSDGRWRLPGGDAVLIDEAWWAPLRRLEAIAAPRPDRSTLHRVRERVAPAAARLRPDRLTAVTLGDVTQDGETELVISFRRPFRRNLINLTRPRRAWVDRYGHSAHLGLYRPDDLSEIWVAGTLVHPVVDVAACDGALAVAYGRMDGRGTIATDAWRWVVFGFLPVEPLPGPGIPTCVDIDGDGRTEPAIMGRSTP
jgi:hypothetical protein